MSDPSNTGQVPGRTAQTTRRYAAGFRMECTGAANTRTLAAMGLTLGPSRELRVAPSVRCWLRESNDASAAAVPGANMAAPSMVFEANSPEVIQLAPDTTHLSVVKDSGAADGHVTIRAVA